MFVQSSQDIFEMQSTMIRAFIPASGRVYGDPVKKKTTHTQTNEQNPPSQKTETQPTSFSL